MKDFLTNLFSFLRNEEDPLDDMLREKGLDPDRVVQESRERRAERGEDDPVNRMRGRLGRRRERDDAVIDKNKGMG